jgi:Putative zinc-finger
MIHESMNCQMLVELVTDWLEGQLPEPTRSEVELHVATCAGCILRRADARDGGGAAPVGSRRDRRSDGRLNPRSTDCRVPRPPRLTSHARGNPPRLRRTFVGEG